MAAYNLLVPDAMVCTGDASTTTGDASTNWKIFKEAYKDYATAIELKKKEKAIQAATLKTIMGKECRQILARLELSDADAKDPAVVLAKLEAYFKPARNVLYERFLFHGAEQQSNESIDQYIIRLTRLAETCNFQGLHDEMLRDRLVLGCRDKAARGRLFRQKECDLKSALESLRISERTNEQLKQLATEEQDVQVNTIRKDRQAKQRRLSTYGSQKQTKERQHAAVCNYCGGKHASDQASCPAYGKSCNHRGKPNHFQSVCRLKSSLISSSLISSSRRKRCVNRLRRVRFYDRIGWGSAP